MYKIEEKLEKINGGKSALARELKITPEVLYRTLKRQRARFSTKQRYTKAFNKLFETDYDIKSLFEKNEANEGTNHR